MAVWPLKAYLMPTARIAHTIIFQSVRAKLKGYLKLLRIIHLETISPKVPRMANWIMAEMIG